ncbi:glycosyltransferase family 2 protein [Mycetocola zhadangensis]|uniref:glycosyltransferase family 2 protein n=1 Tax=Mycetocola zhadangensis TaxID=1164595 RepID=UPI003A4E5EAD
MSEPESSPLLTVAILTYNGEDYLERILMQLGEQELDGEVEVLVIDSGSTDATLEILAKFPNVRLHKIPNSEFGHGRTRNLAAQLGTGEFIAYLTHDAIPIGTTWAREMLAPFKVSPRVVAVMGKQIPRPTCFPVIKYEIQGMFSGFGPDFGTALFYQDAFIQDEGVLGAVSFYSDVNSAARRSFILDVIPYRDVPYAEDQMFGKDLVLAGYIKAYAPRGSVEHSNDLTLEEYGKRIFDETVGLRRIGTNIPVLTVKNQLRLTARGIVGDSLRILRDRDYSWKRKLYWLANNPRYQILKWKSYRKSTLVDIDDDSQISAGSLEHARKNRG